MKSTTMSWRAASWAALAIAAAAPVAAQAQATSDDWRFQAAIYGWFPGISGNTAVPVQTGGANIDVSMGDVIDALKFAFMGSFEARKGQWGLWTDLVYADFGASKSGSRDFTLGGGRPVGVSADLQLDIKSWIWTVAGLYGLAETPQYTADLLFGARYIDMTNELGWTFNGDISGLPLPGRSGSGTADLTNWDGIVGLKGRAYLGDDRRWFVPYYADIGTGQSKLTWQVNAGVGYQFDWGAVVASWRYLDYDFKSSAKVQDLSFSGPLIGVVFKF
ncbi:MAG: hypothetical protein MUF16_04885 [Burkholderiaceae bacterium]|nr:hypothetical protein [Burkholderiaceae bacterium]